eukprot:Phypoly_transcript_15516.p1 GENE.Phypoly_transcript_15516~~Phypoly_transcript_15516.p1  ORF type:complete len:283 (+),score=36.69 Phypoly_transcript_15516:60-851(+)
MENNTRRDNRGNNRENRNANFQKKRKQPTQEGSGEIFDAFKGYAATMDATNDRFERIVKLSRDTTIASKRLIFLLHRAVPGDLSDIMQQVNTDLTKIYENFHKIIRELEGQEYWRYQRAFSPGTQEFVEAVTFLQFLKDGSLLTANHILSMISPSNGELHSFQVCFGDYIQGVADLTGELMRYCITSASSGNSTTCYQILDFMRIVYNGFKALPNAFLYSSKIEVMEASLKKVEQVCFKLTLQRKEFPNSVHFGEQMMEEIEA